MVNLRAPRPVVVYSDPDEHGVAIIFAESVLYFRATMPELYAEVDRIKLLPNRHHQNQYPFNYTGPIAECPWCGDFFPPERSGMRWCNVICYRAHQQFNKRRKAARVHTLASS